MPTTLPPPRRRRLPWKLILCGLFGVLLGATLAGWRAFKYEPRFYRNALTGTSEQRDAANAQLQQHVEQLQQQLQTAQDWELELTEEQLNAWLAVELPQRFARQMPQGLTDPRVSIDAQRVRLAGRYDAGSIQTIVSLELLVALGEAPNSVAIQVRRVRAGAVPLPLERLVGDVGRAAGRSDLPVKVDTPDGQLRLLLTVPTRSASWPDRKLTVDKVELGTGRIRLRGRSEPFR